MSKIIVSLLLLIAFCQSAQAQQNQTRFLGFDKGTQGIGLLLGNPSGFRYIYWTDWKHAFHADAAYDLDGIVMVHGSYAFFFYDAKDQWKRKRGFNSFLFYLAPGIATGFRVRGGDQASAFILGARGVGGFEYLFGRGEWGLRAELGGTINVIGRTFATLQGLVGVTMYFDGGSSKKRPESRSKGDSGSEQEDLSEFN